MALPDARKRLSRVKTAFVGKTVKTLGDYVDDAVSKGSEMLDSARKSTQEGIETARDEFSGVYDKVDENLTPGMAAGGAAATGGAGLLAGSDKEAYTTNRFLERLEAE